jgi:glycosyltransferase involved in cell wall biosynthesis
MRITAFTDYRYTRAGGQVWAERAFALFLNELAGLHELTIVGRQGTPEQVTARYALAPQAAFAGLPYYESLAHLSRALRTVPEAIRRFDRAAADADVAWILGPNPLALAFVLASRARRLPVVLGVRSDLPAAVAARYAGQPGFTRAANALELAWRGFARRLPCVAVGSQLAEAYADSPSVHTLTVSLVSERDITSGPAAHSATGLELLSVGRLDAEKDPLLLLDILARLRGDGMPWRLRVCGEGQLRGALEARARASGLQDAVVFDGYVPNGPELLHRYRHSDALIVPSRLGEGVPQTIVEALASGLPVVSSDVGGTKAAFGENVAFVAPGDVAAMAACVQRLHDDPQARQQMVDGGRTIVRRHTLRAEAERLGEFLSTARKRTTLVRPRAERSWS